MCISGFGKQSQYMQPALPPRGWFGTKLLNAWSHGQHNTGLLTAALQASLQRSSLTYPLRHHSTVLRGFRSPQTAAATLCQHLAIPKLLTAPLAQFSYQRGQCQKCLQGPHAGCCGWLFPNGSCPWAWTSWESRLLWAGKPSPTRAKSVSHLFHDSSQV